MKYRFYVAEVAESGSGGDGVGDEMAALNRKSPEGAEGHCLPPPQVRIATIVPCFGPTCNYRTCPVLPGDHDVQVATI